MTSPDRSEGQQAIKPLVQLPTEVSEYDVHKVEVNLRTSSLGASVSHVIVAEARTLKAEEFEKWNNLDETVDAFDPNLTVSWSGYQRPALAYLNAEEVLRGRLPYEDPDEILKEGPVSRQFINELLGFEYDEEVVKTQDVVEWHIGIQRNLDLLIRIGSPLALIDAVVDAENARRATIDQPDIYFRDLSRGQQRYHQLYNAGLPFFQLKQNKR